MTFDARQSERKGGGSNFVFGATVIAIVGGAFLTVLAVPPASAKAATVTSVETVAPSTAKTAAKRPTAKQVLANINAIEGAKPFLSAMAKIDTKAVKTATEELARLPTRSDAAKTDIMIARGIETLKRHADELVTISTSDIDALLDDARTQLRRASRKGDSLCSGAHYDGLTPATLLDPQKLNVTMKGMSGPLRGYQLSVLTQIFTAIDAQRETPSSYGKMTHTDEAALDGVIMSLVSDPDLRPFLMPVPTSDDTNTTLDDFDMCSFGATAMLALKTLPDDTKGRVFAELVGAFELGGGRFTDLSGL